MNTKVTLFFALSVLLFGFYKTNHLEPNIKRLPLVGTWELISGKIIEKGDTVVTDYTKNTAFIKIINATHFAFLQHDLRKGKEVNPDFAAGGGTYSLEDNVYTEHLAYCSDRNWEGNDFKFNITLKNDTLTQTGIEKIDSLGVNRMTIETYKRVKLSN